MKYAFWSESVRPWLARRAQRHVDRLTERLGGPARRQVVLLLGLVLALNSADNSAIGAIAGQLEPGLRIGTAELGLLVTVSSLVGALAAIPSGVLTDKTRRVRLLSVSILLWGVAEAVSGFSTSFTMLVLTRLALGAVTATAVPAVASLTGDFFPAGERGRIYGFIITGEVVGAGFGIAMASLVSGLLGWRAAFVVLALPSIALAWAIWKNLPEPARGGQSRLESGRHRDRLGRGGRGAVQEAAPDGGTEESRSDDIVLIKVRGAGHRARRGDRGRRRPGADDHLAGDPLRAARAHQPRIIVASSLGYFFLAGLRTFAVVFAARPLRRRPGPCDAGARRRRGRRRARPARLGRTADRLIRRGHLDARIVVAASPTWPRPR